MLKKNVIVDHDQFTYAGRVLSAMCSNKWNSDVLVLLTSTWGKKSIITSLTLTLTYKEASTFTSVLKKRGLD